MISGNLLPGSRASPLQHARRLGVFWNVLPSLFALRAHCGRDNRARMECVDCLLGMPRKVHSKALAEKTLGLQNSDRCFGLLSCRRRGLSSNTDRPPSEREIAFS